MPTAQHTIIDGKLTASASKSGLKIIAGQVSNLTNGNVVTITFPALSVSMAMGTIDTAAVAPSISITNGVATVTFTAGGSGTLQYIIVASLVDSASVVNSGGSNVTINPSL